MSDQNIASNAAKSKPLRCVVTSDKMNKSRVGTVKRLVKDDRFLKYVKRSTKVMFHDENNETKEGDIVLVAQARPKSSRKKFDLLKVIQKAKEV